MEQTVYFKQAIHSIRQEPIENLYVPTTKSGKRHPVEIEGKKYWLEIWHNLSSEGLYYTLKLKPADEFHPGNGKPQQKGLFQEVAF